MSSREDSQYQVYNAICLPRLGLVKSTYDHPKAMEVPRHQGAGFSCFRAAHMAGNVPYEVDIKLEKRTKLNEEGDGNGGFVPHVFVLDKRDGGLQQRGQSATACWRGQRTIVPQRGLGQWWALTKVDSLM